MYILLNKGKSTSIDDEDYDKVKKYHWCVNDRGYVVCFFKDKKSKKNIQLKLHRFIMDAPKGKNIDHIDRNTLNNQKNNLRFASQLENVLNRKVFSNNKSGYTGVSWEKANRKWRAQIGINKKEFFLGLFSTKNEAIEARKKAEKNFHANLTLT